MTSERNTTTVLPVAIDLFGPFMKKQVVFGAQVNGTQDTQEC